MKEDIAEIKQSIKRAETFLTRRASILANREELIAKHDCSLDAETCAALADIDAGLKLADACEPQLLLELQGLLEKASSVASRAESDVRVAHDEKDEALRNTILASAPEDIRDAIDYRESKAFKAEFSARFRPGWVSVPPDAKKNVESNLAYLRLLLDNIERSQQEIARCSRSSKKAA